MEKLWKVSNSTNIPAGVIHSLKFDLNQLCILITNNSIILILISLISCNDKWMQ